MSKIFNHIRADITKFLDKIHTFEEKPLHQAVEVDLRLVYNPPVFDQGQLGSCTANSAAFLVEYAMYQETKPGVSGGSEVGFMGSRLFIYYNERLKDGDVDQDAGAQVSDSIAVMSQYGVCPETLWPYDVTKFKDVPPQSCYDEAVKHKCDSFRAVQQSFNQILAALASGYPMTVGLVLFESFQNTGSDGLVPDPQPGEAELGGHCIAVVGYKAGRFICRNSWGPNWGDKGYFYLPKYYLLDPKLSSDFWIVIDVTH